MRIWEQKRSGKSLGREVVTVMPSAQTRSTAFKDISLAPGLVQ